MGLSVIAQLANVLSTNPVSAGADAGSGLPGEFAALLSGQTLSAVMSLGGGSPEGIQALADASARKESAVGDNAAEGSVSVLDPAALIAMLGSAQLQPTIQNQRQIAESRDDALVSPDTALNATLDTALDAGQHLPNFNAASSVTPEANGRQIPDHGKSQAPSVQHLTSSATTIANANTMAAPATGTPASAEKAMLDAANIAARSEPGTGTPPVFSEALSHSLHQRTAATNQQPAQLGVSAHMSTPAWSQQFSEKIVWMAHNEIQSAQIQINPPQLGPLQITLNLSGDQASAIFASPHPEVRQAIENSMPQLKEMLASAGISLGDTNVGANLAQQNPNTSFLPPNRTQSTLENAILPANDNAPGAGVATPLQQGRGLVDLFA